MASPNPNPVNYNSTFSRIGKVVKYTNFWLGFQNNNLSTGAVTDFSTPFDARLDLVPNVVGNFQGFVGNVQGWIQAVKAYSDDILQDLQTNLSAPSSSTSTILPLMIADMTLNGQTVQNNTIAALNIQSGVLTTNVGTGILRGTTNTSGGVPDERIISEYVVFTCTADQYTGANPGGETFSITGYPSEAYFVGNFNQGNGTGTPIVVANEGGGNFLTNGDFEDLSGTFPNGWNVSSGSGFVYNSSVGHSATSTASMAFGNTATGTVTVSQNIAQSSNGTIQTHSTYAAGIFMRTSGSVSGGSNLQVAITGTGFTTVNLFNASPSTLTTAYQLSSGFFNIGGTIPPDLSLTISWTASNAAGGTAVILFDDAAIVSPSYFGNAAYVLYRGTADFIAAAPSVDPPVPGDSYGVLTSNNFAGIFQSFFGRVYGVQLPSSGSPSIADSLAQ